MPNSVITFCIMTLHKTPWLIRNVSSIRTYCPTKFLIKILSQGYPDKQLLEFLKGLKDNRIQLITSQQNIGFGGGRKLLSDLVTTPFTMMPDDDIYLTENSIQTALKVFQRDENIGAVSMPQYDLQGRMLSPGGNNIFISNGVIRRQRPVLNYDADWIEVNDLDAGAMLFRTRMKDSFSWDPGASDFEDLDKSLQIIRERRWKQAIVPKGRLIHDRSWLWRNKKYERIRLDGLSWRRSYRYIRKKWGLRLDLQSHILFELVYPAFTLAQCQSLISGVQRLIERRIARCATSATKASYVPCI